MDRAWRGMTEPGGTARGMQGPGVITLAGTTGTTAMAVQRPVG
jgi:hypothetical protein